MDRDQSPLFTGHMSYEDHALLEKVGNLKNLKLNRNRSGKQRLDTYFLTYEHGESKEDSDLRTANLQERVTRLAKAGFVKQVRQGGLPGYLYLKSDPEPEDVSELLGEHRWHPALLWNPSDWNLKGIWTLERDHGYAMHEYWRTVLDQLAYPDPEGRGWSMRNLERRWG